MILSVHLATVGRWQAQRMLLGGLDASAVPGMSYAEVVFPARFGNRVPRPRPGRVGLIAGWRDDAALDRFLSAHPFAERLSDGWHTRLEPLHCFGSWAGMEEVAAASAPVRDDEPVAALTLGRLRLTRTRDFLKSARPTERDAIANPAVAVAIGFGRFTPPRLVSTFSVWRSFAEMRDYAFGKSGSHQAAVRVDRRHPFHRESAFIRFRPYASVGSWDGRDPVAAAAA